MGRKIYAHKTFIKKTNQQENRWEKNFKKESKKRKGSELDLNTHMENRTGY